MSGSSCARASFTDFATSSEAHERKTESCVQEKPPQLDGDNAEDDDGWGVPEYRPSPYELLRSRGYIREGLTKRVTRWLRAVARAEGIECEGEDDPEPQLEEVWGMVTEGPMDWDDAAKEMAHIAPDPHADEVVDPKLVANFHFVEKMARRRKLSSHQARRLHLFFRASTDEKIQKIQEIIRYLLPYIEHEKSSQQHHSQR